MSGRAICPCCGQEKPPSLSIDEYKARALPRLSAIDRIAKKIDFGRPDWSITEDGQTYARLMEQQARDEFEAGL